MITISLWQPWASLIAIGAKKIETRSWYWAHRGPLAIHAAKGGLSKAEFYETCIDPYIREALLAAGLGSNILPRGAIVAVCNMDDCFRFTSTNTPDYPERAFGDFFPGRFGFRLSSVKKLRTPIPYRGAQGPFNVADQLLNEAMVPA